MGVKRFPFSWDNPSNGKLLKVPLQAVKPFLKTLKAACSSCYCRHRIIKAEEFQSIIISGGCKAGQAKSCKMFRGLDHNLHKPPANKGSCLFGGLSQQQKPCAHLGEKKQSFILLSSNFLNFRKSWKAFKRKAPFLWKSSFFLQRWRGGYPGKVSQGWHYPDYLIHGRCSTSKVPAPPESQIVEKKTLGGGSNGLEQTFGLDGPESGQDRNLVCGWPRSQWVGKLPLPCHLWSRQPISIFGGLPSCIPV